MKDIKPSYSDLRFMAKCAFTGGLIMFACMAFGELWIEPQLFGGFIGKPGIWPFIFIESAVWLVPFLILMLPLLKRAKALGKCRTTLFVAGAWVSAGAIIIIGYKQVYYPGAWNWSRLLRADITFGWTLPCILILMLFVVFSVQHLRRT